MFAAPATDSMSTRRSAERHSVLLVEDEPVLRASMTRGLAKLSGVDVMSAGTVRDARRAINANPPDLVIADLDLPDGSGIEVVGELDRVGLRVPIVFVSAFVGQYRGRLPKRPGTDVFEKPISLERLRRLVDERLKEESEVASSPFGVADYIQLAGMGRRSVVIEVRGRLAGRGAVLIRGGEVWSARDEQSEGIDAFRRLAFLKDAVVTCRPLESSDCSPTRTITGSCESVLLEAARCKDELEATSVDGGWENEQVKPDSEDEMSLDIDVEEIEEIEQTVSRPPPSTKRAASSATTTTTTTGASDHVKRRFDACYEDGVDALLAKRFAEAYQAFCDAEMLVPGDSRVQANLARLRQMGHGN